MEKIKNFEEKFISHLENQEPEFLKTLAEKKDLDDGLTKKLKEIIEGFKKVFNGN